MGKGFAFGYGAVIRKKTETVEAKKNLNDIQLKVVIEVKDVYICRFL